MTIALGAVDSPAVATLTLIYDRPEGRAGLGREPQGYRVTGHPVPTSRVTAHQMCLFVGDRTVAALLALTA